MNGFDILGSVFGTTETAITVDFASFGICALVSLALGFVIGMTYRYKNNTSEGFTIAMGLLPLIVQTVIMLVSGNLGAAVAVMGVFSLVRFRSMPGSARDIVTVFEAMAAGLACGMGYIGLAIIMVAVVTVVSLIYVNVTSNKTSNSSKKKTDNETRVLKVTVPEDVNFENEFEPVLSKYCSYDLTSIETSNMGSLYQVRYNIKLNSDAVAKDLIDELRCLNGNLKISLNMVTEKQKNLL